ncbi:hypothetical protein MUB24_17010 [Lederbergia sp. NSJ-179]|uniref:hypothetical protein n=1 Tax=Lederbergia sp. NSJ-179 TaxID=2931402 RepID=UPI001FD00F91|nr:hypothetical protein [Lederbergia sp. NSJ-179]MCJ7842565.1 hypothetical protein [Lederbergia sp. NSJ-179]
MSNVGLLVLLIPLFIIGFLYWLMVKKSLSGRGGPFQNKRIVKALLPLYAVVLILSPFVYELLPKGNDDLPLANEKDLERKTMELEQAIYDGRLKDIDPQVIREEWEESYDGTELSFRQEEGEPLPIVVERKPENDGVVEGKYIASVIYHGIDFSDQLSKVRFQLEDDALQFAEIGNPLVYRGVVYKSDFVLAQFREERNSIFEPSFVSNARYIYLRIPKDLEIQEKDEVYFNYTGEVQIDWNSDNE